MAHQDIERARPGKGASIAPDLTRQTRTVLVIGAGFLVFHAVLAAIVPLIEDEAYYALWASAPAWGYYDHPPMIAWWIAVGEGLFGRTEFGVRFVSVLAFGLVTLMTARTAYLLGGMQAAVWSALLLNATVVFFVMGFVATPDAPSVFFWAGALWAATEWLNSRNPWWWLVAGLCVGLGVLSKFTNLFLAVGFVAWGLSTAEGRRSLRIWQVWAGAALAVAVLSPYAVWNAANDWIGLSLQFGRVGEGQFARGNVAELAVQAILAITPLVGWFAIRGTGRPRTALLIWLHAPLALYLVWHGLFNHIPPNWLAPLYPAIAVLAGLAAPDAGKWMRRAAAPLGLALGTVPIVYILWHGSPVIPGNTPFNQVRGWDQAVVDIRDSDAFEEAEWIATSFYGLTGLMWWYFGEEMPVYSVRHRHRYLFREPFPQELCDRPALLIQQSGRISVAPKDDRAESTVNRQSGETRLFSMQLNAVQGETVCPPWAR